MKNKTKKSNDKLMEGWDKPKPNYNKEILKLLKELWDKNPNMRLGQLLENYVFIDGDRGDKTSCELYYQYDEKTIKRIKEAIKKCKT